MASVEDNNTPDLVNPSRGFGTLAKLPNELLDRVFKEAHTPGRPVGPLSRDLLPFQRRAWYGEVDVEGDGRIGAFVRTVIEHPEYGPLVGELRMRTLEWSDGRGDPDLPSNQALIAFFTNLSVASVVSLSGPLRLIVPLLSERTSLPELLPSLRVLCLSSEWDGWTSLHDPSHWAFFSSRPLLYNISISTSSLQSMQRAPPRTSPSSLSFTHVTRLSLDDLFEVSTSRTFLSHFPSLTHLSLTNRASDPHFVELLSGVQHPSLLQGLSLSASKSLRRRRSWSIAEALPAFSGLTTFHLQNGYDAVSPSFFDALRRLPLRTLSLGRTFSVSGSSLIDLVSSGTQKKHPTLSLLVLDIVHAACGTSMGLCGPVYDPLTTLYYLHDDWELPEWPETCTADDVRELVVAGKRGGVQVRGSAVEALEVEDAWEEEERLLDDFGRELNDLTE
ncbi:hypothetical protein JCM6882_008075 [Rhodosporidiobolus microsporus]